MLICATPETSRAFNTAAEADHDLKNRLSQIAAARDLVHIDVNKVPMRMDGQVMLSFAASVTRGKDVVIGMSEPVRPPIGIHAEQMMCDMRTLAARAALAKLRV